MASLFCCIDIFIEQNRDIFDQAFVALPHFCERLCSCDQGQRSIDRRQLPCASKTFLAARVAALQWYCPLGLGKAENLSTPPAMAVIASSIKAMATPAGEIAPGNSEIDETTHHLFAHPVDKAIHMAHGKGFVVARIERGNGSR